MAIPDQPVESADIPEDAAVPAPAVPILTESASLPAAEHTEVEEIADGVERSLDPRSITVQRIVGWIVNGAIMAGLLLVLLLVLFRADLHGWVLALLVLLAAGATLGLAWLAHRWPEIEHRHASYKVDGRGIEIRRGVVWRKVIHVPRSRVQHTDVSQGPLERSHGLATLILYTAGTSHARVDLHGLDHATALRIRDHFVQSEGYDAV